MIFYDRVGIVCKTKETSASAVTETFNGTVPAIVVPVPSVDVLTAGGSVTQTRYQFIIKPFAYLIPLNASSTVPSTAGANQILFTYGGHPSLLLEGKVERHLFRGRLHHYEAIVKA
ncbi:hypothetical protein [Mycolicibacterium mageritense]|uniref:hypothetical protein n=1 Tax=Mycolicibacterium mageritense TaxID=53462 RepID=UPI0011D4F650|nr:hypothetical protein [Mycolicibacterium mageritense]TXI63087.1 MAG: hypothetical protein E6Q55_11105 [Mycolicibacterium mageritense]